MLGKLTWGEANCNAQCWSEESKQPREPQLGYHAVGTGAGSVERCGLCGCRQKRVRDSRLQAFEVSQQWEEVGRPLDKGEVRVYTAAWPKRDTGASSKLGPAAGEGWRKQQELG